MSGSAPASELVGINATTSSFFVVMLDIPFNVVFHAAAPLTPLCSIADADQTRRASQSPTNVVRRARQRDVDDCTVTRHKRHIPHCDAMSRDHTPEAVRRQRACSRLTAETNSRARYVLNGPTRRCETLSRPRSRSVCDGKYCSVSSLLPADRYMPAVCRSARATPLRPSSATTARHLPAINSSMRHRQLPTAATGRLRVTKQLVNNDVTVNDDDDTATISSSALGDSGVTSLVNDDAMTSRDTSPWSSRSGAGDGRGVIQWMTDTDRQSQLRRFLDAVSYTSSDAQLQHQPSTRHNDVTDDDDDVDVSGTETRRTSVSELSEWHDGEYNADDQSVSAMDQVRHLVTRCRLPVHTCDDDTCIRTGNHQSTQQAPMTSESLRQAVLGAATDLVRAR